MNHYLKRRLEGPLREAMEQFPVVLITGPRQAGKSTLLQHLLKDYTYVSFDDPIARSLADNEPELFLKAYPSPVIIDEIQYVPSLLQYIKKEVDENRRKMGQYILTGSQVFQLMKGVSESLAGRIMIFQLYPLSWDEIPKIDPTDQIVMAEQMLKGFYPEFQVVPKLKPKYWHSAYLSTYLERDLRTMRNIHDLGQFQRFMVLLAARAGQILNLNEVGKECGISQTTAKDWVTLLQATGMVHLLEPFFRNITKRVIKSPKLYFVDTGVLCYLLRIETPEQLIHSPFAGHVFENMVIMEKIKSYTQKGERPRCYFYRSSNGLEADLIIDNGETQEAYEIKFTTAPNKNMIQSLAKIKKQMKINKAELLCLRKEKVPFSGDITAQHWRSLT